MWDTNKVKNFTKWLLSLTLTVWLSYWLLQAWNWLTATTWDSLTAEKWNNLVTRLETLESEHDLNYEADWITQLVPLITHWKDQDTNCDLEDITIGDQTWAGCNSTIGTWIDYVPWYCYNYAWTNNWSNCGWYATKESVYNLAWVDNIWWKLYTQTNAQNACGTWYHLPTITEWIQTMINLDCNDITLETTNWDKCIWLWWNNNWTLKDRLKIPLSGYNIGYNRGNDASLWTSSNVSDVNGIWITLIYSLGSVRIDNRSNTSTFSVRCIKD
jgi:hypothetical protein